MVDLRETATGVRVPVTVQPRASNTEVVGEHGDTLKIRLAAPPVDGAANEELIRFLAKRLRVSAAAVRIVGGQTSKRKLVEIDGVRADAVLQALLP